MAHSTFFYNSTRMNCPNDMQNHIHSSYEIYYLESGSCRYLINNALYEIIPGDIVFIQKEVIHKTTYLKYHSRLLINCSDEYLGGFPFPQCPVFRNKKITRSIWEILKDVEKEYFNEDGYSQALMTSDVVRILSLVNRNIDDNEYENQKIVNAAIADVLLYIHDNYTYDITLLSTAHKYSFSPDHLSRLFKKETGVGFNDYISLLRMKEASNLLKSCNGDSISEIATKCGYDDSNYFSMKFKKTYGIPPLKYRKSFLPVERD